MRKVATLYLHGRQDGCIGADVGADVAGYFTAPYQRVIVEDAGHFLHLEQPRIVFDFAIDFLRAVRR